MRRGFVLFAGLLMTGLGCSDNRTGVPVSGIVTQGGKPLANINVSFQPEATPGAKARTQDAIGSYGLTDAEGRFTLKFADTEAAGALAGSHSVRLSEAQSGPTPDGGPTVEPRSRIPARFSDGSTKFEVPAGGTDQANFDLNSK